MERIARRMQDGIVVRIVIEDGRIRVVEPVKPLEKGPIPWVSPGWFDLQVNGIAGYDFNAKDVTAANVIAAVRALAKRGVAACLPTVITESFAHIRHALAAIAAARESSDLVRAAVPGIHLEGPYISGADGPRGAHNFEHVRDPDLAEFAAWQEAAGGRIKLVTLAPERPGATDFIRALTRQGVVVSLGHTMADTQAIEQAVEAGATMSTHLGNGAHPILPRHPNYIWDQLADDRLWGCFIADGHHLPASTLKAMMRAKRDKTVLVSDAVRLAGMPPGEYETAVGGSVVLHASGRLSTKADPAILAGSASSLADCIEHAVRIGGLTWTEAVDAVTVRPAQALGLHRAGTLAAGEVGSITLFTIDENNSPAQLQIEETVICGQTAYKREETIS